MEENTTNFYVNLEEEILKFLIICHDANNQTLSTDYIKEKLEGALFGRPIVLHQKCIEEFERIKEEFYSIKK